MHFRDAFSQWRSILAHWASQFSIVWSIIPPTGHIILLAFMVPPPVCATVISFTANKSHIKGLLFLKSMFDLHLVNFGQLI